jgi:hypothetical protein
MADARTLSDAIMPHAIGSTERLVLVNFLSFVE